MKLTIITFVTFLSLAARGDSNAGHWKKALSGLGTGSSRQIALKAAQSNLDMEVEAHEELCDRHGGDYLVEQHPEERCQQFYPLMNWRCSVVATVTCRFP